MYYSFLLFLVLNIGFYFGIKRLVSMKFNFNSFILFIILNSFIMSIINYFILSDLKMYIYIVFFFFNLILVFKFSYLDALSLTLYVEFLSICYVVFISFIIFMYKNAFNISCFGEFIVSIRNNSIILFIVDILFVIFAYIFSNFSYIRRSYNCLRRYKYDNLIKKLLLIFVIVLFHFWYIYYLLFSTGINLYFLTTFVFFLALILHFSINNLVILDDYNKTKLKYNDSLDSLSKCEDLIDKYRIANHENKNHLLVIRTLIKNNDDSVNLYIDNLVDTVYMENEKLFMDLSKLPSSIKASIYIKLVKIDNLHISYKCNIDKSVGYNLDVSDEISLKVCNILNVFLDNAIDEVYEKKKGSIVVNILYDESNELIKFMISNNVDKNVSSKIFDKGYTTKSNGHGYGLSLVKEIINSDKYLSNEFNTKDGIFTQILFVKNHH